MRKLASKTAFGLMLLALIGCNKPNSPEVTYFESGKLKKVVAFDADGKTVTIFFRNEGGIRSIKRRVTNQELRQYHFYNNGVLMEFSEEGIDGLNELYSYNNAGVRRKPWFLVYKMEPTQPVRDSLFLVKVGVLNTRLASDSVRKNCVFIFDSPAHEKILYRSCSDSTNWHTFQLKSSNQTSDTVYLMVYVLYKEEGWIHAIKEFPYSTR